MMDTRSFERLLARSGWHRLPGRGHAKWKAPSSAHIITVRHGGRWRTVPNRLVVQAERESGGLTR